MKDYKYYAEFDYSKEENIWDVSFIDFPNLATFGDDLAEAYEMARDILMLEIHDNHNLPVPTKYQTEKNDNPIHIELPIYTNSIEINKNVKEVKVKKIPQFLYLWRKKPRNKTLILVKL